MALSPDGDKLAILGNLHVKVLALPNDRGRTISEAICIFRIVRYSLPVKLSVVIITYNEEENIQRTLESVQSLVERGRGEIIVVDSGSTDRTVEIAQSCKAKVFVEPWKGFAAQKNSAIQKATGDWILSLDADEALDADLQNTLCNFGRGSRSMRDSAARRRIQSC